MLMFSLALTIGLAQERTVRAVRARVGRVKRWGGWIMVAVGIWTLALAAFPAFFREVLF